MRLEDILAPLTRDQFFAEYYRKKPLYLPAHEKRPAVFDAADLDDMLSQASHWTESNFRVWIDKRPVPPEQYCSPVMMQHGPGRRPDMTKARRWFDQGASFVLNHVDDLTASMRAAAACLEAELLGMVSANIYLSRAGRQAFDSHYDDHEVFSFHIAGEKTWRVYKGRIDNPVGQPSPRPGLQQMHDRAKGEILFEQRMAPGDFLYLPRGQYHDALADGGTSLHVTFSVIPLNGLALFSILEAAAVRDTVFRDDLPNSNTDAGKKALAERLGVLGERLRDMMRDPALVKRVIEEQQSRIRPRPEARFNILDGALKSDT